MQSKNPDRDGYPYNQCAVLLESHEEIRRHYIQLLDERRELVVMIEKMLEKADG